jgi:excisionase family DNA binding protein
MSTGISHPELHGKPLTVTVEMARKISGLGNTTIWELIKNKKLESTNVGRRRLILYSSLENLLSPKAVDSTLTRHGEGVAP